MNRFRPGSFKNLRGFFTFFTYGKEFILRLHFFPLHDQRACFKKEGMLQQSFDKSES